jgi:hypothetical protein
VQTRADLRITVKNDTGTDVNLIVRMLDGQTVIIPLDHDATWSATMKELAQLLILPAATPEAMNIINLKQYKMAPKSAHADLEITLYATDRFAKWWYGPYSYYATWQELSR